jgi:SAM-dependent methyltransferase
MRPLALWVPPSIRRLLRRAAGHGPRNLMTRDASALTQDVDAALAMAAGRLQTIARLGFDCSGLRVVEIGPGHNFGTLLLIASHGAVVTAADRFLAPWDDAYHPALYRMLRDRWTGPAAALDRVIANGGYSGSLTLLAEPAERLDSIADGGADLVFSTSVLEHVFDLPAVCSELARITRIGGFNHHVVDFRWHRVGFNRPLDFLLHSERRFRRDFDGDHGECGNRWRAAEVAALFRSAGFAVSRFTPEMRAEPDELARILPKLRRASSPYRTWPEDDLSILTASFELTPTDDPTVRAQGAAELAAQRQRKSAALA